MNISTFLIILQLIKLCCGEIPMSSCSNLKPFKTKDNSCDNFTNICVKKDDADCKSFLEICSQCPATNYSVLMFHDIAQVKAEKKDTDKKLLDITIELQNLKADISHTTVKIHILLYVCIAIILLLLLVLILEIRFKLISKLLIKWKSKEKYVLLDSRKSTIRKDMYEKITGIEDNLKIVPNIDKKLTEILQNFKNLSNSAIKKTKFYINGYNDPVEIEICKKTTIVQVKKQICGELQNCVPNNYKIMKLSLNGKLIDGNKYFSTLDLSSEDKLICEFDKSADPNEFVVIQLKGNVKLPKYIQIEKYQIISYLRTVINKIENIRDYKIFIRNKNNANQLKEVSDKSTIKECQLQDDDVMQIISQKNENLEIASLFNDGILIKIEYSNVDIVANLRKIIAEKLEIDQNKFFLILNDKMLNNDKFAFEYLTEHNLPVKICKFMNLDDIIINEKFLDKGMFAELFTARIKRNNVEILIKRYNIIVTQEIKDNFHIAKELLKFQLTKSHPRFIQVLDLYHDDYYTYVAMENMSNGTLSLYLKGDPPISKNCIAMWSLQILEGLKFLHKNEINHRDLNPKSVLLDASLQIKLSNFNLSKYPDFLHQQSINSKRKQVRTPLKYLAPETILNEISNYQTDVWSFGAILLRIATKRRPFDYIKKIKLRNEIFENGSKDYKCPNDVPNDIKKIIEICMKVNPNDRPTVRDLLKEPFIRQTEINENP